MDGKKRVREATKATIIGSIVGIILTIVKIAVGLLGRSSALVADGVHSLTDLVTDIILILGFRAVIGTLLAVAGVAGIFLLQ